MKILELGHVVLYVSNLQRSANFYKDTLGFNEITRDAHTALFSSGRTHHELLLIEVGGEPKKLGPPSAGLYHIGFKIGNSSQDIQDAYTELSKKGVMFVGAGDHHVTHSLYILDPDNNELELYADVNDDWKENPLSVMTPVKHLPLE
jgi:catechol 2,3-dioxygenase